MITDDLDTRLLAALRVDGRRSVSDLSAELGVSRATVRSRIDRLRETGVIRGFTVVLTQDHQPMPVRAAMMLRVEARRSRAIVRYLTGFPEAQAIHSTNGRWDLMVELTATDLTGFDAVLDRIRLIDGVTETETTLLLTTHKQVNALYALPG